jgi:polyphenol oxidase
MIHKEFQGMCWLEFELLIDCPIRHGCFMRYGGFSQEHLSSLNLGRRVGDNVEHLEKNFRKVSEAFGRVPLISARLCHGATVTSINSALENIPISDGLSTNIPGVGIMVTQADCQAAIFYDPIHHAMANVHCGWRGIRLLLTI